MLPFSLQLIKKYQVMRMAPLLFAVFLLLLILALGELELVPLLVLLTLCLCLLRQNRAPLDPPPLLIVVRGQLPFLLLVLQVPVSWLRRFLVLVLGTERLSLVSHLACILQCWVSLVLQLLMLWLVFAVLGLGLVLTLVNLEP